MAKLVILGTANALPTAEHQNAHMALVGEDRLVLVDCVGTPTVRLSQAGLDYRRLTDIVLTHFHPDHVSGVPALLMNIWLLGRTEPLNIYSLEYTLERVQKLMELYEWDTWPGFYPVHFHALPAQERVLVLESSDMQMFASPGQHLIPNIGLRVEFPQSGRSMAYSSDTEPSEAIMRLAAGVDVLLHEATGSGDGHSSAVQAGQVAQQAGAGHLYLIHYQVLDFDPRVLVGQAKEAFSGPVTLAEDFMELDFS